MSLIISPFIPFPNISWWAISLDADTVCFDKAEHFQKMSLRNRYYIAAANSVVTLSIPLLHGRNQRTEMQDVHICNKDKWQMQHWRTLTSAYNRSPYFSYYAHSLQILFEQEYATIIDFNLASVHWLKEQLQIHWEEAILNTFKKNYDDANYDLRIMYARGLINNKSDSFPTYYQVFQDRNGFIPDLSMLDLLFAEGPYALNWLRDNRVKIKHNIGL
ncbi:MAG: WbqC family protein [Bacteroidota bacterium]